MTRPTTTGKAQDLITFTRSTTGTYLGSDGLLKSAAIDEARIEYDAEGNCLGLLVEEARTNVLEYSEGFTTGWGVLNITRASNAIASPDGAVNGARIQEDSSGTGGPRLFPNNTAVLTANQAQTLSCFFKAGTSDYAYLTIRYSNGNVAAVEFDLTSGTVNSTTVSGNMALNSSDITSAGNGWYRCSVTATSSASTSNGRYFLGLTNGSGMESTGYPNYALTGKNIYIYGAQVETGSFPTSYIPTSGSAVTRAADVASLAVSEFGYNQDQGTVVATGSTVSTVGAGKEMINLNNGTNSNYMQLNKTAFTNQTRARFYVITGNTTQAQIFSAVGSVSAGSVNKHAGAFQKNDFAFVFDGSLSGVDTVGEVPPVTTVTLGASATSAQQLNGHIKSVQYYPLRLSNAQLQALTV